MNIMIEGDPVEPWYFGFVKIKCLHVWRGECWQIGKKTYRYIGFGLWREFKNPKSKGNDEPQSTTNSNLPSLNQREDDSSNRGTDSRSHGVTKSAAGNSAFSVPAGKTIVYGDSCSPIGRTDSSDIESPASNLNDDKVR